MEVVTFCSMAISGGGGGERVEGLQQLTQHWWNGSNMSIWLLLWWIITSWGTNIPQKCFLSRVTFWTSRNPPCVLNYSDAQKHAEMWGTVDHRAAKNPECLIRVCACAPASVCGGVCQARRWQGVGRGLWTWLLCLAPPVTESEGDVARPWLPQLGQSGMSARGRISACLPPCAALWHRSPYGL